MTAGCNTLDHQSPKDLLSLRCLHSLTDGKCIVCTDARPREKEQMRSKTPTVLKPQQYINNTFPVFSGTLFVLTLTHAGPLKATTNSYFQT